MNINRHNYEELFLLYVDNELSAQERASVEKFVLQNPDLKNELDLLNISVLGADEIVFKEKQNLFKKEQGISVANYESYFLLFVDNELNDAEKSAVEKFVLKHPALQQEFIILQKTKLTVEHIPYENKEKLYRNERRIVPLLWMRMSVAAVILGVIALSWFAINQLSNKVERNYAVSVPKSAEEIAPALKDYNNKRVSNAPETLPQAKRSNSLANTASQTMAIVKKDGKRIFSKKEENLVAKNEIKKDSKVIVPEIEVAKNVVLENKNTVVANEVKKDYEKLPLETVAANEKIVNIAVANISVTDTQSSLITQAAYTEVDANNDDDKTLYIGSIQINKNKLKGLFKKASGIFGKKDKKEPNDKSIQVAGFEIRST